MVSAFVEEKLKLAFSVLGGVVLLSFVLTFLKGIYSRILRGGKNLKLTYGTWGNQINAKREMHNSVTYFSFFSS